MSVRVRFAPSPTGRLHIGNIRAALFNWLFAHAKGGVFMLRLDDTDRERSREEFAQAIQQDLRWLGLTWDEFARQSDRLARYAEAAEQLKRAGRLYACYETPQELERRRSLQLARKLPPIYDRAALQLSEQQRAKYEAEGRKPHWRFRLDAGEVGWEDAVRGPVAIDAGTVSDPVLIREDGMPLYTFSSVVDDIDFRMSHVIRGEDHVTNTLTQIQIFRALGAAAPVFGHFALLVGAGGQALSKRDAALGLGDLRQAGLQPMAINSLVARLGSADPVEPKQTLGELAAGFDLSRLGRAAARFDPAELRQLSARILHGMDFAQARPQLLEAGLGDVDEAFWLAVRTNLEQVSDAREWWQVVKGPITPVIEDAEYLAEAVRALPPEPWTGESWSVWTASLKERTGRKGRALFHPLRLALTARERGPDMHYLLPLIARERASARLSGQVA